MRASHALLLERPPPFFSARGVCLASTVVDCRLAVLIHVTTVPLEREPPPLFLRPCKINSIFDPVAGILGNRDPFTNLYKCYLRSSNRNFYSSALFLLGQKRAWRVLTSYRSRKGRLDIVCG